MCARVRLRRFNKSFSTSRIVSSQDLCAEQQCLNGGTCVASEYSGVQCLCKHPYMGQYCHIADYTDIDTIALKGTGFLEYTQYEVMQR